MAGDKALDNTAMSPNERARVENNDDLRFKDFSPVYASNLILPEAY